MSGQSLGLIETVGMAAAVEAADAAMKSANVNLVGYELTKGGGMVTVKLEGEIGAINAAVAAAISAASRVGSVYAHKVIARTAQHIEHIIHSSETVGVAQPEPAVEPAPQAEDAPSTSIPVVNVDTESSASCMDIIEEAPQAEEQPQPDQPTPEKHEAGQPDAPQESPRKAPRPGGKKR
ncbi:BMC domain-containing protein [Atlantibacter hermannii]|uniref:BMC domain-containing protein n=1 Tax=Atlantibacter hermannii TaxID=565 RepID=UPI002542172D|nr:BMC domain-containing protein [Atlantibacter hermannii]WIF58794.1 BMC domain-containing protein [Atlantibacter hermannii]